MILEGVLESTYKISLINGCTSVIHPGINDHIMRFTMNSHILPV